MGTVTGCFVFDPKDAIYADHFPGHGVVPGSLIVQAFLTAILGLQGPGRAVQVEDFRFQQFITPGDYAFSMETGADEAGSRQWVCRLMHDGRTAASGTIIL